MIEIAVYDTKPYDREYLAQTPGAERVAWRFHEFRLSAETAPAAKGAQAVCIFVNAQADRPCLEILAALGVKLIALRCAGYNNVDVPAARALGLAVVIPAFQWVLTRPRSGVVDRKRRCLLHLQRRAWRETPPGGGPPASRFL